MNRLAAVTVRACPQAAAEQDRPLGHADDAESRRPLAARRAPLRRGRRRDGLAGATARDLAAFIQAHLDGHPALPVTAAQLAAGPVHASGWDVPLERGYGRGWFVEELAGHQVVSHSGLHRRRFVWGLLRLARAAVRPHGGVALTGSGLAVAVALAVLGVAGPANWIGFVLGLVMAAAALFAIGLVIGSLISSPSAAGAVPVLAWLPLMVLGGLWFPREAMPATMRMVSDFSPVGAAVDIIQQAWFRGVTPTSSMLVLALTVVTLGVVAVVTFRWE